MKRVVIEGLPEKPVFVPRPEGQHSSRIMSQEKTILWSEKEPEAGKSLLFSSNGQMSVGSGACRAKQSM